jgi:hypothetical protein
MKQSIGFLIALLFMMGSCMKQEAETSNTPQPYAGDCFDSIRNNGETGIDCGGPCSPCPPTISALVNGSDFYASGNNVVAQLIGANALRIVGTETSGNYIQFNFDQSFSTGTYYNIEGIYHAGTKNFITSTATVSFTQFNTADRLITGTFSFTGVDFSSGGLDSAFVTNGEMQNIQY